jgi:hypothetical protein
MTVRREAGIEGARQTKSKIPNRRAGSVEWLTGLNLLFS